MSDSDHSLDILIRTTADPKPVEVLDKEMQDLIKTAGKNTESTKEGTKAAKGQGEAHREVRKAIRELSEQFPILGAAAHGAFSVIGGAIAIALAALSAFKKSFDELAESTKTADWTTSVSGLEAMRDSLREAALAAEKYSQHLADAAAAAQTATAQAERMEQIEEAKLSASEKVAAAQEALEKAKAETITDPVARATRLLEIEQKYAAASKQRADAAEQERLARKSYTTFLEEQGARITGAQLSAAERRALAAGPAAVAKGRAATEQERLDATAKQASELEEQIKEEGFSKHPIKTIWEAIMGAGLMAGGAPPPAVQRSRLLDSLTDMQRGETRLLSRDRAKITEAEEATRLLEVARVQHEAALARARAAQLELSVLQQTTAISAGARGTIAPLQSGTRQTTYQTEVQKAIMEITGNSQLGLDIIKAAHGNTQLLTQAYKNILARLDQQAGYLKSLGLNAGGK